MPQFVLVPGAWLGAWAWSKVVDEMRGLGQDAVPVTLTGMGDRVHLLSEETGMESAVQDVLSVLKYDELADVVLVGHSFAGKVAAAVADRVPDQIRKVVYVDAFRPERVRDEQGGFDPQKEFGSVPAGSLGIPLTEPIVRRIGPDVTGSELARMLALSTPWPLKMARDPIRLTGRSERVDESYVFCSRSGDPVDEIVQGKWGALYGPHRVLDSGHWPMLTTPAELAHALVDLTR